MTTTDIPESTALIPWSPPQSPEEFARSEAEKNANEIARSSLEAAKYEARSLTRHLVQILPPLTGQYAVGCARISVERLQTIHLIGDRKIEMEIYAPTRPNTGNKLLMRPARDIEKGIGREFSEEQLQELYTYSEDRIEPIGQWPIVIFSNGMGCEISEYRLLLEQLASHGYLVLNLNHASSSSSLFENVDEKAADEIYKSLNPDELAAKQADNIRFVIQELRNGRIRELGRTDQIFLAGHSLGGAASILVSRTDPDIKGCINLDGGLKGPDEVKTALTPVPTLLVAADHRSDSMWEGKFMKEWQAFIERSGNVDMISIEDTHHLDFGMCAMLYWLLGKPHLYVGTLKAHSVASQAMVQFMDSAISRQ